MAQKRRKHSDGFKFKVALAAAKGMQTINEIASAYNLHPNQVSSWKKRLLAEGPTVFSQGNGSQQQAQAEQEAPPPIVSAPQAGRWTGVLGGLLILFFAAQVLLPLRNWLYPGDTNWTQEGFRFSWRVMLVENTGDTVFFVHDPATDQTWTVYPGDYLTRFQEAQMAFQPPAD